MLSETQIKNLKPKDRTYKVSDRDGLYLVVTPSGTKSFRYNYKINGRYETITFGRWKDQITLAEARQKLLEAKKLLASGVSPSIEKKRAKSNSNVSQSTFAEWADKYLDKCGKSENTISGFHYIVNRYAMPKWASWQLSELTFQDMRNALDEIAESGAPASAAMLRKFLCQLFDFAIQKDANFVENPARRIKASSIYTYKKRERALSADEIATFCVALDDVSSLPQNRIATMLLLLTMVRKSELIEAKWSEIDFENRVWSIPAERMKMSRPHNVYLSRQALDLFKKLQALSSGSEFVLEPMSGRKLSKNTLNGVVNKCIDIAKEKGLPLESFTPHDFRRTASTHLHEAGYNSDVIEKCLAHEQQGVRAIYNRAEYAEQRRELLQAWADMVEGYCQK